MPNMERISSLAVELRSEIRDLLENSYSGREVPSTADSFAIKFDENSFIDRFQKLASEQSSQSSDSSFAKLQIENKCLVKDNEVLKVRYDNLLQKVFEYKEVINIAKDEMKVHKQNTESLIQEKAQLLNKSEQNEEQLKSVQADYASLLVLYGNDNSTIQKINQSNVTLVYQLHTLQKSFINKGQLYDTAISEIQQRKEAILKIGDTLSTSRLECSDLVREKATLTKRVEDLLSTLAQAHQRISSLTDLTVNLRKETGLLESRCSDGDSLRIALQEVIATSERVLAEIMTRYALTLTYVVYPSPKLS